MNKTKIIFIVAVAGLAVFLFFYLRRPVEVDNSTASALQRQMKKSRKQV